MEDQECKCRNCIHDTICNAFVKQMYGMCNVCNNYIDKNYIYKLEKENESMKRKIFGLETTINNYRRKDAKRYEQKSWRL